MDGPEVFSASTARYPILSTATSGQTLAPGERELKRLEDLALHSLRMLEADTGFGLDSSELSARQTAVKSVAAKALNIRQATTAPMLEQYERLSAAASATSADFSNTSPVLHTQPSGSGGGFWNSLNNIVQNMQQQQASGPDPITAASQQATANMEAARQQAAIRDELRREQQERQREAERQRQADAEARRTAQQQQATQQQQRPTYTVNASAGASASTSSSTAGNSATRSSGSGQSGTPSRGVPAQCTNYNNYITPKSKWHTGPGACTNELHGSLTNNSGEVLACNFYFGPHNGGQTNIGPDQTQAGAGGGIWACDAQYFKYRCYPKAQEDQYYCLEKADEADGN